jgi:hypothetical protein
VTGRPTTEQNSIGDLFVYVESGEVREPASIEMSDSEFFSRG